MYWFWEFKLKKKETWRHVIKLGGIYTEIQLAQHCEKDSAGKKYFSNQFL